MSDKVPKFGRIKPKNPKNPTAEQQRFHDDIRALGCLICHKPASIHHVHVNDSGRLTKNHWLISNLCPDHHQGPQGIHMLGHTNFIALYHIDLFQTGIDLIKEYRNNTIDEFKDLDYYLELWKVG